MKPYYDKDGITIFCGDCRDVLPTLGSVDLVVTDPPYVFGIASTMQQSSKAGGWGDLMNSACWYAMWFRECYKLTANTQGAMWVFNSWRSFPVVARAAYEADWPIASLMVWDRQWIGPGGHQGLRPSYELVALMAQPEFTLENRGLYDIWPCQWAAQKPNGHPAEKPVKLIERIITESVGNRKSPIVLDPFMGSGTTLEAAQLCGARAIGIEIEPQWCEIAVKRLRQSSVPASKIKPDSKRIYVAGPYTRPDPCWNTARATVVGDFLCDRGYAPFVPHLSHHWHTAMPRPYQDWLALDLAWLGASHVMLRIPGESSGADEEEAFANANGIPVHHSLRTLKIALCDDGPFDWPEWDDFFAGCRMTEHRIGMIPK